MYRLIINSSVIVHLNNSINTKHSSEIVNFVTALISRHRPPDHRHGVDGGGSIDVRRWNTVKYLSFSEPRILFLHQCVCINQPHARPPFPFERRSWGSRPTSVPVQVLPSMIPLSHRIHCTDYFSIQDRGMYVRPQPISH